MKVGAQGENLHFLKEYLNSHKLTVGRNGPFNEGNEKYY